MAQSERNMQEALERARIEQQVSEYITEFVKTTY